ncbi:Cof-type HAD-IIB family hydrolase [Aeromicrobium sp. Leaf350]|uniref:Cof-type HAD-IIB family hydrolase n=1 Tax=Aeromicrobium sp. Leaf350 TaxID=2876565 RepID=UPI001E4BCD83|nr:Cof-type HAD-IIB family hydrolase [Aeromicrobium sp. Leaf350]
MVVVDMDGTLLDGRGEVPDALWPLLRAMHERGIAFVPASGRQHATLARLFDRASEGMPVIAENGTYVARDGVELASVTLDRELVITAVALLRDLAIQGRNLGVVLCGKRSAYVERTDETFLAEARRYYVALASVDDLLAVDDDVLKLAIFDFDDAETGTAPSLERFRETHQVVVSGEHWIDVMAAGVNKGHAVRMLQAELGVTAAQTAAFGDYLNDLEMLDAADLSFAMANAHPEVMARARYTAPSNTDLGVVTTLRALLGTDGVSPGA